MKRTNLRSNPEDAEHFKRHRDRTWSMLAADMPQEKAVEKLVAQGVPPESAQRVVRAVGQEVSLGKPDPAPSINPVWWAVGLGVSLLALWLFYANTTTESTGLRPKDVVKAIALLVVIGILVLGLHRGRTSKSGK